MNDTQATEYTGYIRKSLNRRKRDKRDELVVKVSILKSRMERLTDFGTDMSIMSALSDIQGLGSEIERITAELMTLCRTSNDLTALIGEAVILDGETA